MPVNRLVNKFGVGVIGGWHKHGGDTIIQKVSNCQAYQVDDVENLIAHLYVMSNANRDNVERLIAEIERDGS
jgi:hypothetical protein